MVSLDNGSLNDVDAIVIIGLPRSGTTALQRLIASDPRVFAPEETWMLPLLNNLIAKSSSLSLVNSGTAVQRSNFSSSEVASIAFNKLSAEARKHGKKIFVEKTPRNYLVDFFQEFDSKKILIVRHPRDILASFIVNFFASGFKHLHGYYVDIRIGPERCIQLSRLDDVFVIKYEDLSKPSVVDALRYHVELDIDPFDLAIFPGEIGDKDQTPFIKPAQRVVVSGLVKKIWINRQLRKCFSEYISEFEYDELFEVVCWSDVLKLSNFNDLFWLSVFQVRLLIAVLYCSLVARKKNAFYL